MLLRERVENRRHFLGQYADLSSERLEIGSARVSRAGIDIGILRRRNQALQVEIRVRGMNRSIQQIVCRGEQIIPADGLLQRKVLLVCIAVGKEVVENYERKVTAHLHLPRRNVESQQCGGILVVSRIFEVAAVRCARLVRQRREILLFDLIASH